MQIKAPSQIFDWVLNVPLNTKRNAQKMKFSIKDFFSKCDQIHRKLRIWSHYQKKSLIENFIFCVVAFEPFNNSFNLVIWKLFGKNLREIEISQRSGICLTRIAATSKFFDSRKIFPYWFIFFCCFRDVFNFQFHNFYLFQCFEERFH